MEHPTLRVERVRILCSASDESLLVMKWRDPLDGHVFWEPPGGGIEPGETPRDAAVRELYEETGFSADLQGDPVIVERSYRFAGRDHHHLEAFFAATVEGEPSAAAFTGEETDTFLEWRFVTLDAMEGLDAPLQPPSLAEVARQLLGI